MPDFQQAKIYKLVCDKTDKFYIGSTTQPLFKRLIDHKSGYKSYLLKKSNYISSYDLYALGDVRIILIAECACDNLQQLKAIERQHIELNKHLLVNRSTPNTTKAECDKKYRVKNKEQISEKQKERYNTNKEKLLVKATEYRIANKDKIKESQKLHYQRNKDKIKARCAEYRKQHPDANRNYYQLITKPNNNKDKIQNNLNSL
jgi:hypothetical protein